MAEPALELVHPEPKKCGQCGKAIKRGNFCGQKCWRRERTGQHSQPRLCLACDRWLPGDTHLQQIYCSAECRYKDKTLRHHHGIGIKKYQRMVEAQGGVCAICEGPPDRKSHRSDKEPRLFVDHDHDTGEIRGLLCHKCNAGIGLLRDSAEIVEAAARYLRGESDG